MIFYYLIAQYCEQLRLNKPFLKNLTGFLVLFCTKCQIIGAAGNLLKKEIYWVIMRPDYMIKYNVNFIKFTYTVVCNITIAYS
jgi:hypothetical protein